LFSSSFRINGVKIPKGEPRAIKFRDKIMLSDQKEKYYWRFLPIHEDKKGGRSASAAETSLMPPPAKRVKFSGPTSPYR
jgi:hypothetical protein